MIEIKKKIGIPKYKQIINAIENAIENGLLKKGDQLPSINTIKNNNKLSRDTVLMAFNELKNRGIIESIVGKGYYVLSEDINVHQKIFLLFDELNSFKEDLYNSFLENLEDTIQVDILFHDLKQTIFQKRIKHK
jgi:DNA-binding GntR family transcriptional regulator